MSLECEHCLASDLHNPFFNPEDPLSWAYICEEHLKELKSKLLRK